MLLAVRLPVRAALQQRSPKPWATPVRIDVNHARLAELTALTDIGRTRAAAIVLHRLRHGPFRTLADLAAVDGLGPKTVQALAPFIRFSDSDHGAQPTGRRQGPAAGFGVR